MKQSFYNCSLCFHICAHLIVICFGMGAEFNYHSMHKLTMR